MRQVLTIPIGIALATAAAAWNPAVAVGEPVHEVQVVAKKFAFEPQAIEVTAGEPVRIVIHSEDTVHGFSIRQLDLDVQIPRGGATTIVEFTAPPAGRYEITCSEFCGRGHGQMKAELVSVPPSRGKD
jgi:heme/copper-type cytochrome/quinol oxidase subunit 2